MRKIKSLIKKTKTEKLCRIYCILFIALFAIDTLCDYINYSNSLNSAPFRIWVYVNVLYYILPAIFLFVVERKFKKLQARKKNRAIRDFVNNCSKAENFKPDEQETRMKMLKYNSKDTGVNYSAIELPRA